MKNRFFKLMSGFILTSIPLAINAGDCPTHPHVIHDIVIDSCENLTAKNAASISQGATPSTIASHYHGAILSGTERRTRTIEVDNPSLPGPTPMEWLKTNKSIKVLLVSEDPGICSQFPKGKRSMVIYYTNCECDTGPHADGYCALTVKEVHAIPKEYKIYAR